MLGALTSIRKVFPWALVHTARAPNRVFRVSARLAYEHVRHIRLPNLGAVQVHPSPALVALNHRPPGKRLHAVARDQLPRIVIYECMECTNMYSIERYFRDGDGQ